MSILKINGVAIKAEEVVSPMYFQGERAWSNFNYIKPYFDWGRMPLSEFKTNSQPTDFCKFGYRPRFDLRVSCNVARHYSGGAAGTESVYRRTSTTITVSEDTSIEPTSRIPGVTNKIHHVRRWSNVSGEWTTELDETTTLHKGIFLIEMIGAGGAGSGGSALLSGVGGGAGAYMVLALHIAELLRESASVTISVSLGWGGWKNFTGGRGQADAGENTSITISNGTISGTITCGGGSGANEGTPGAGGSLFSIDDSLSNYVQILTQVNGQSGTEGVLAETSTSQAVDIYVGNEGDGDTYRLQRSSKSITASGAGAGVGGSSQFGAGGADGKTGSDDAYDGKSPSSTSYGAGGGGGHGKAFSSSYGGIGMDGCVNIYG